MSDAMALSALLQYINGDMPSLPADRNPHIS
jgi:hypothetical protein